MDDPEEFEVVVAAADAESNAGESPLPSLEILGLAS
jgi:hypothetical protein